MKTDAQIQLGKRARQVDDKDLIEDKPLSKRVKFDQLGQDTDWAKLGSITTSTTREIPASALRITGSEFKIGRNDFNDLQVLNPLVSGLHATIMKTESPATGKTVIELLDSSSNGTFINGKLVSQTHTIFCCSSDR